MTSCDSPDLGFCDFNPEMFHSVGFLFHLRDMKGGYWVLQGSPALFIITFPILQSFQLVAQFYDFKFVE